MHRTPGRGRTRRLLALTAAVGLLVVAACGDDDDDDAGGNGATGEPIKVLTFQSLENPQYAIPQVKTAAEAAVKGINDRGGINGRPLDLTFCDTNFDPNQEAACARQAADEGAIAVVGSASLYPNAIPLLERAGVPFVGGQGLSPTELTSPVSFPLAGTIAGWFQGIVAQAQQEGVQRPGIISTQQVAAVKFALDGVDAALRTAGIQPVRTVDAPVGAPDQSTAAAQAVPDTDAVFILSLPGDAAKFFQAIKQLNYPGQVFGASLTFTEALAALGPEGDGLKLTSLTTPVTKTDNPEVARFRAEMDAVDPTAAKDERSAMTWASYQLVAEVLERMDGEINAATFLEAMNSIDEPIDTGFFAPYSTSGVTPALPEYPRLLNPSVVFTEVRGGEIVQTSEGFENPFAILAEQAGG